KLRYNLNDELLGLGRVASIGKVIKFRNDIGKFTISPTMGVLRPTLASRNFLFQVLKSNYISEYFSTIISGSTRSSVGMIVLRKVPIPVPKSLTEQTRIATILSDMDAELEALEAQLGKARKVKHGMMQELLTGRVRLV
ncbi:MAG: restriction endonuclease subunit S, partial [Pedobacter sp.]